MYTDTQLHRPKHTTSTKPWAGDRSGQEKSVASRGCSPDRGIPLTCAVLYVPKASQYGSRKEMEEGDIGNKWLTSCATLDGGEPHFPLGLARVASYSEFWAFWWSMRLFSALESDGGYEALEFQAAPRNRGDTHSSAPHGRDGLQGGGRYWTYALVYGFAPSFFSLVTSRRMTNSHTPLFCFGRRMCGS